MLVRRVAVFFGAGLGCVGLVAALPGTSGCSFNNPATTDDAGYMPPADTGTDVADAAPPGPTVLDPSTRQDIPADLSCIGTRDGGAPDAQLDEAAYDGGAPALGQLVPTTLFLDSFSEGTRTLPGAQLELYYANTFQKGDADVTGITTDDAGLATAPMPSGWQIGYRVLAKADPTPSNAYIPFYELDQQVPPDPTQKFQFFGMTKAVFSTLALAIGAPADYVIPPNVGVVSMRVTDCQRRYMRNVTLQLLDVTSGTAAIVPISSDCLNGTCLLYLSDLEVPSSATMTSRSGLVAMTNLSISKKYRILAHGYYNQDSNALVGHRDLEVVGGALITEFVQP